MLVERKIKLYSTFVKRFVMETKVINNKKVIGYSLGENLTSDTIKLSGDVFIVHNAKIGAFIEYCKNPAKYDVDIIIE